MRTVTVAGYYGAGNAGDETILQAVLADLRRVCPKTRPVVFSRDPGETRASYGVSAADYRFWRHPVSVFRLLRRAGLLLIGGGGLLQDVYPRHILPYTVLYYFCLAAMAKAAGCKVMLYANGIGPLQSRLGRCFARWTAAVAEVITVRDEDSCAALRHLGIDAGRIRVTADPAMGWQPQRLPALPPGLEETRGPLLALSVRPWPGPAYLHALAQAADHAVTAWGMTPVLVPLARGADRAAGGKVAALMSHSDRAISMPELEPEQVYAVIARCEILLGMRLHALIFAAKAGVPMVGLAYDPKIGAFMGRLGLAEFALPLGAGAEEIWQALCRVRGCRPQITGRMAAKVEAMRVSAGENAEFFRELLAKT